MVSVLACVCVCAVNKTRVDNINGKQLNVWQSFEHFSFNPTRFDRLNGTGARKLNAKHTHTPALMLLLARTINQSGRRLAMMMTAVDVVVVYKR